MKELKDIYRKILPELEKRLKSFKQSGLSDIEYIFGELAFCLMTPQSKALMADRSLKRMKKKGCLLKGSCEDLISCMTGVRFHNNKSAYIIEARQKLLAKKGALFIAVLAKTEDLELRNWLQKEIKGLGLKEASHFMRNIGRGSEVAILDRHILRELKKYNVIASIPQNLGTKQYLAIEKKMKRFSEKIKIDMEALDFVFWYGETGYIFK